uniref:Uncharacterized protein n=1 Tax=Lotus japonicus TaxID=34305 RepID=I3S2V2_LOTJA|nr:unknown [Lotus japonicus]
MLSISFSPFPPPYSDFFYHVFSSSLPLLLPKNYKIKTQLSFLIFSGGGRCIFLGLSLYKKTLNNSLLRY